MNAAFLNEALHWLLRVTGEASVMVLAVLALRSLLGTRLTPAWRVALWMVVAAKFLLPAFVPTGFGLGGWSLAGLRPLPTERQEEAMPAEARFAGAPSVQPEAGRTLADVKTRPLPTGALPDLSVWLAGAWMVGGLALLVLAGMRQRHFMRQVSLRPVAAHPSLLGQVSRLCRLAGVHKPVEVRLMPAGTTPAITGLFKPVLLLPENWQAHFDETRLKHVLLHEILHVRHRDLAWNWAFLVLQALHWFNPLVWLAGALFQADRELRCDAAVLGLLGPRERLDYGRTLLHVQETFSAPPAIAGLAPCVRNHPALLQRITMIARPNHTRPWLQAVFTLTFGIITCYAFATASAADEKDIPVKERSREATTSTEPARPQRDRGKEGKPDGDKPRIGERDGDKPRTGPRDGDKPRTGERDGDKPRTGPRDGDKPRTGERDGDKPRTGPRDGDKPRTGGRDGDRPKTGERDSGRASAEGTGNKTAMEALPVQVLGDHVLVNGEEVPLKGLRGHLHHKLGALHGSPVRLTAGPDVPVQTVHAVMDALRDNGFRKILREDTDRER